MDKSDLVYFDEDLLDSIFGRIDDKIENHFYHAKSEKAFVEAVLNDDDLITRKGYANLSKVNPFDSTGEEHKKRVLAMFEADNVYDVTISHGQLKLGTEVFTGLFRIDEESDTVTICVGDSQVNTYMLDEQTFVRGSFSIFDWESDEVAVTLEYGEYKLYSSPGIIAFIKNEQDIRL